MQKSDSIGELAKSLAIAQGKIKGAVKDQENPFFKSKYADLASVWDACREALSANGLAVIQTTEPGSNGNEGSIIVETILAHSSGEWIAGHLKVTPVRDDPQGMGSALTYARRYALSAMVGVAPEDDDGNLASNPSPRQQKATQRPNAGEITALKKTAVDICKLLNKAGDELTWSAKQLDEFAVQQYGLKADALELEPMRELVKKLQLRLDGLKKKPAKPKEEDRESVERADAVKRIRAANEEQGWDEGDLARYVAEKWETDIDSAPLDLLNEIYESLKTETAEF